MRKILLFIGISLFLTLSEAQPLKYSNEFTVDYHGNGKCISDLIQLKGRCAESKLSLSFWSGNVGDFQVVGVAKLTGGNEGKVGGQAWLKINPYLWIGGETITNATFSFDHEVLLSGDLTYGSYHFFPYISLHPQSEHIGGAGFKLYIKEMFSVGFHVYLDHTKKNDAQYSIMLGFKLSKDSVDKVKGFFKVKE